MKLLDRLKALFGRRSQQPAGKAAGSAAKPAPAAIPDSKSAAPAAPARSPVPAPAPEEQEAARRRDETIRELANALYLALDNNAATEVTIGSLMRKDASACFPGGPGSGWDCAVISLNAMAGKVFVDLSTYPQHAGPSYEHRQECTVDCLLSDLRNWWSRSPYGAIRTDEDWARMLQEARERVAAEKAPAPAAKTAPAPQKPAPAPAAPAAKSAPAPKEPAHPPKSKREQAMDSICAHVIQKLRLFEDYEVPLCSWVWEEAGARFAGWDSVSVLLHTTQRRLRVELSMYPNQFGASREDSIPLTPESFYANMEKWGVPEMYREMRTRADWDELLDNRLKEAVAEVGRIRAQRVEAERLRNRVVIPDAFYNVVPAMKYHQVDLILDQRYGASSVTITQQDGAYCVSRGSHSYLGRMPWGNTTSLKAAEAVWLEKRIDEALRNPDQTTFTSLPGGDRMTVTIREGSRLLENREMDKPLHKYIHLQSSIQKLAQYGSVRASETDRKPD